MVWFLLKVLIIVVLAILIRGTLPRYRIDQLTAQHWKLFLFLFLLFIYSVLCLSFLYI